MSINQPTVINLSGVSFRFEKENVLEDISIQVEKGDFVGIIGPNGSGKTTLLRIILGLLIPQQGQVALLEKPIREFNEWFRVGYVPQKAHKNDHVFPMTVEEVVLQGRIARVGLFRGLSTTDKAAAKHALKMVGMDHMASRLITELSGGQQQRVFLARALASEPELLILDEPTVGVDIESQEEFYDLLSELRTKQGLTLLMVSHDVEVVLNEVNKIICLNKRLVYQGTPQKFIKGEYLEKLYGQKRSLIMHGH